MDIFDYEQEGCKVPDRLLQDLETAYTTPGKTVPTHIRGSQGLPALGGARTGPHHRTHSSAATWAIWSSQLDLL